MQSQASDPGRTWLPLPLWIAPAVLLLVAVGPWPYGFYVFLRLVVFGTSGLIAWMLLRRDRGSWLGWCFVALAVLYNPIIRVHFERSTWAAINLISMVPFVFVGWSERRRERH